MSQPEAGGGPQDDESLEALPVVNDGIDDDGSADAPDPDEEGDGDA